MIKQKFGFTLAEVLIVIGIIGVVAALTLPNLNHATGDKETVTRLQKAYSILNEANDRAVAIYGPISTWTNCQSSSEIFATCWMNRVGEFLKISKSCNYSDGNGDEDCSYLSRYGCLDVVYQLTDGITFNICGDSPRCDYEQNEPGDWGYLKNLCTTELNIDIDGSNKGKNEHGYDNFRFEITDDLGIVPYKENMQTFDVAVSNCLSFKEYYCTWWVLEYGNLDYLKADEEGKCNDSNIILDGVTNTSCH